MRSELTKAIDLLQRNTPEAINEALGLLQNTVYSFSMKVCGHPEDAEDTMQEVLFRSLKHLGKLQDPRALSVWLYTVTRNRCWRMRRKTVNRSGRNLSIDELMPDDAELAALLEDDGSLSRGECRASGGARHSAAGYSSHPDCTAHGAGVARHGRADHRGGGAGAGVAAGDGAGSAASGAACGAQGDKPARHLRASAKAAPAVRKVQRARGRAKERPTECRDLFAQLSEYLDGRIEPASCEEMERHIKGCPACVAFLGDLRRAIERCRGLEVKCDPAVAKRLCAVFTREYLRLIGAPEGKNSLRTM